MGSFCLLRLGAPHAGHAALVEVLLASGGPCLALIGSGEVVGRPDVPLAWTERRDILLAILRSRGVDASRLVLAPLPELRTAGWDARWCAYVLDAARRALGVEPRRYVFGDDYDPRVFARMLERAPGLSLVSVPRRYDKSARELRIAIATQAPGLLAKYDEELASYPEESRARIARACASGVDRP